MKKFFGHQAGIFGGFGSDLGNLFRHERALSGMFGVGLAEEMRASLRSLSGTLGADLAEQMRASRHTRSGMFGADLEAQMRASLRSLSGTIGAGLAEELRASQRTMSGMFDSSLAEQMRAAQRTRSGMLGSTLADEMRASLRSLSSGVGSGPTSEMLASLHTQLASNVTREMLASRNALLASAAGKDLFGPHYMRLAWARSKESFGSPVAAPQNIVPALGRELAHSQALRSIFGPDIINSVLPYHRQTMSALFGVFARDDVIGLTASLPAVRTLDAFFQSKRRQRSLAADSPIADLLQGLSAAFEQDEQEILFDFFERFVADLADQAGKGPEDPALRLEHLRRLQELWAFALGYLAPILLLVSTVVILAANPEPVAIGGEPSRGPQTAADVSTRLEKIEQSQKQILESVERMTKSFQAAYDDANSKRRNIQEGTSDAQYYVVKRSTNVYTRPVSGARTATVLYPNENVRLVERKGRWIKVAYYDLIAGEIRVGWMLKKYLIGDSSR